MVVRKEIVNPYRPGAGHSPPYLAGREEEIEEFRPYLEQTEVTKNVILTGLRGVGKTVLMDDKLKPMALDAGWVWVGSDFSESSFLSEENLCTRLLTDLSVFTSSLELTKPIKKLGFDSTGRAVLSFDFLATYFGAQPGLAADKLKAVLELAWAVTKRRDKRGIIFAYDEAQVVQDQRDKEQYPLALMLEVFQSLQRKGAMYMLVLTGLPTLFPKLVESRTYAERMFAVQEISRLSREASRQAIIEPLRGSSRQFAKQAIAVIVEVSDGYPYFIQFICREAFDYLKANPGSKTIPIDPIVRKLDSDFFAGRWEILTDRQRDLLFCISELAHADEEFTISEIVEASKKATRVKSFVAGDVSQMLPRLIEKGLVYKNRHGRYAFAVPLFARFIQRKYAISEMQRRLF